MFKVEKKIKRTHLLVDQTCLVADRVGCFQSHAVSTVIADFKASHFTIGSCSLLKHVVFLQVFLKRKADVKDDICN